MGIGMEMGCWLLGWRKVSICIKSEDFCADGMAGGMIVLDDEASLEEGEYDDFV